MIQGSVDGTTIFKWININPLPLRRWVLLSDPSSLSERLGDSPLVQGDSPLSGISGTLKTREYAKLIVKWDQLNQPTGEMGTIGSSKWGSPVAIWGV